MPKYTPIFTRRALFLALTFGVGCFFVSTTFSFADDLSSLQQDIIYAKDKQQSFSGKVDTIDVALNKEKATLVQQEAERLIEELKKSGYASAPAPVKSEPAKTLPLAVETQPVVKEVKVVEAKPVSEKKSWVWPTFGFGKKTRSENKPEDKISEGEALYKVAVSDNKITMQESIDIGLANNVQIQAAKKSVEVAQAKLAEAKRALYPAVQAVAEFNGGHVGGAVDPTVSELGTTQRFYKGENHKVNVSQPLYYGGELVNTVKQAEENVKVAKAEYDKYRNDFIHEIRVAYYGVIKAEYNTQYQIELFEKVSQVYKRVKEEHEAKLVPEVDYLNVESQYFQVLYQVESAKNDTMSAEMVLRQTLYLNVDDVIPVDLKLDFVKLHPDFDELLGLTLKNSADIRIKSFSLEAARYGIDIANAKKLPRFDLRGSFGYLGEAFHDTQAFLPGTPTGDANNDLEKEWYLGVHGSMPLGANSVEYDQIKHVYGPTVLALTGSDDWRHHVAFNLWDKLSNVTDEKTAEASLLQAEAEYQKARNEITLKLRDDFYTLQKSLIQIDSSIAKAKYQEKQSAILEYLVGMQESTAANYVESLINHAQDRFAFIQAVTDYNISVSSLATAMGDPYYFETKS